ncbi:hypothetical protein R1sor_020238 [Riccia sorocarpa]|uniref:No apical meristem-associated C-terminal domain-containing protein n=1 Tax=Riccia sorocarpa TaxID=122646 RepID=A0ABD3IFH4_9MARC
MAKKKKKSKVKRMVGSTPMDVNREAGTMDTDAPSAAAMQSGGDTMDTSEIVVTEEGPSRKLSMTAGISGRTIKKGPQKRKAAKLRKNKALERAMSVVDKQEQRIMKQELKSFRVQTLKKMDDQ